MQLTYMRSVSLLGKFTSGSCISASHSDLLKLPNNYREYPSGISELGQGLGCMEKDPK